ncbi:ketoacyl-ACP synthase III [Glycomyces halotolerans]
MSAAVLTGLGTALPDRTVTNDEMAARLEVSPEWIERRTGIQARRLSDRDSTTSALAARAAENALDDASLSADGVDALIVATYTPDYQIPATAPIVAAELGLGDIAAFDVNAACSGFVYALATARGFIAAGADRVLVVGAETASTLTDPHDKTIAPLFGDGAGAVLLRSGDETEPGAILAIDLGSDGSGADLLIAPGSGSHSRLQPEPADYYMTMDGREVFMNAVSRMTASSRAVIKTAGYHTGDIDRICGHQANLRILRAIAEELGVGPDRLIANIDQVGNTGAASIPLALDDARRAGGLEPGELTLLTAFGGGFTWGSALLRWPEPH